MIKKILLLICTLSLILFIVLIIKPHMNKYVYQNKKSEEIKVSECIDKNSVYKTKFISKVNNLNSIGIYFSTYFNPNEKGNIKVIIYDENNNELYNRIISASDFIDNNEYVFQFETQEDSFNKEYTVEFSYNEYVKNCLAYWSFESENFDKININQKETNEVMIINQYGIKRSLFAYWYPLIVISMIVPIYVCIGDNYDKKNKK